jgi:hypothetical protein
MGRELEREGWGREGMKGQRQRQRDREGMKTETMEERMNGRQIGLG